MHKPACSECIILGPMEGVTSVPSLDAVPSVVQSRAVAPAARCVSLCSTTVR